MQNIIINNFIFPNYVRIIIHIFLYSKSAILLKIYIFILIIYIYTLINDK